jgi:hypothetical protein
MTRTKPQVAMVSSEQIIEAIENKEVPAQKIDILLQNALINLSDMLLLEACDRASSEEKILILIDRGLNISARSSGGYTLLHRAVFNGRTNVVLKLIENKFDINAKNNNGETALHFLSAKGNFFKTASALIEAGIDINAKNNNDETAIIRLTSIRDLEESKKIAEAIIITAASSQRCQILNEKGISSWDLMLNNELKNPKLQNFLNKEVVTFLAIILPQIDQTIQGYSESNDLRRQIIATFNLANLQNPLNSEPTGKIEKLRDLRKSLIEAFFSKEQEGKNNQDETVNIPKIEAKANAVIASLLEGENLKNISNYFKSAKNPELRATKAENYVCLAEDNKNEILSFINFDFISSKVITEFFTKQNLEAAEKNKKAIPKIIIKNSVATQLEQTTLNKLNP